MITRPSNYLCSASGCTFLQYRRCACGSRLHCTHPKLTRPSQIWTLSRCPKGTRFKNAPKQDDRPDHVASLGGY